MKKLISAKSAANVLLVAMGALAVFHVLVLAKVLPSDIVWGGRMGDAPDINLVVLETTALLVTLLFALIIAAKAGYVRLPKLRMVVHIGAWIVFAYFTLNIIGNLASSASVEKLVFSPISIVLSALALRLAIER
jgi:hypothetical protein